MFETLLTTKENMAIATSQINGGKSKIKRMGWQSASVQKKAMLRPTGLRAEEIGLIGIPRYARTDVR
jgi:hypothetical protein